MHPKNSNLPLHPYKSTAPSPRFTRQFLHHLHSRVPTPLVPSHPPAGRTLSESIFQCAAQSGGGFIVCLPQRSPPSPRDEPGHAQLDLVSAFHAPQQPFMSRCPIATFVCLCPFLFSFCSGMSLRVNSETCSKRCQLWRFKPTPPARPFMLHITRGELL